MKKRMKEMENGFYDAKEELSKIILKEVNDATSKHFYLLDLRYIDLFGKLEKAFPNINPPKVPDPLADDYPYIS